MGYARDPMTNKVYETDAEGNPIREVSSGPTQPAPRTGQIFTLPPNPKDVREQQRQAVADARAARDQQLQEERDARAAAQWNASHNPDGSPKADPAATKPSEFQSKSAGFLGRMMQAEKDFASVPVGDAGSRSLGRQVLHNAAPGVENSYLNNPNRQRADQAVDNFIAASLRQESGASISPAEFDRQYRIFYPAPGDSAAVIAQKAAARKQAIEGFRIAAGPLADQAAASLQAEKPTEPAAPGNEPPPLEVDVTGGHMPTQQEIAADPKLAQAWGYRQSVLGQGLSGVNEGIAGTIGLPVDAATGAINLGIRGVNALTNGSIPRLDNSIGGSQWLKDNVLNRTIFDPTNDPTNQFARRVGQSVGSAVIPAAGAGTLRQAGTMLGTAVGGGIGGATAQQVAPGNVPVEMAADLIGSAGTGAGFLGASRRAAMKQAAAAVPTVEQLKEQAGSLYRQAEARGVVAGPDETKALADTLRSVLQGEGNISPTGRLSDVYPKAKEAMQLVNDYSGQTMNPTQMQTVRSIASDALSSSEPKERRLGSILTKAFDEWANPMAPELKDARDTSSRYIQTEQLERLRERAGAKASQYTGSGFENALRQQYRGMDLKEINDQASFHPDVVDAIQKVGRGTPASNFARGLGKLAPTGVVSAGGVTGMGAMGGSMFGSPMLGGVFGAGLAGAGIAGRTAATRMGINAADEAELIARNGGKLPDIQLLPPAMRERLGLLAISELMKYQRP